MLSPRGVTVPAEHAVPRSGDRRCARQTLRRLSHLIAALLPLLLTPGHAGARSPQASWDNLCEQCHGDVGEFAAKYLWYIDDRLEGRHHVDDLHLFLRSHYLPGHEQDGLRDLLSSLANTEALYVERCGECHGPVRDFVDKSIWVRKKGMSALGAGVEVEEFLATHRDIPAEDIDYYLRLFVRMARNGDN